MAQIYFEGHSNFRVKDDVTIWIDPFFEGNSSCVHDWRTLEKPDLVLVTHDHQDHLGQAVEIVKETGAHLGCIFELASHVAELGVSRDKILNYGMGWNLGGTVEFMGVEITMYQSLHSSHIGVPVGYVVKFASGFTFYHAGDTSLFSDMKLIGEIHEIDLAMLPIGDVFTMNAEQAARAAKMLNTKSVIPMHYKTFPVIEQTTDKFEKALKVFAPKVNYFFVAAGDNAEYKV